MESMLLSNEEQLNRRQRDKINEKIEDKKYFQENLVPQLLELKEQKNIMERERVMSIKKYKEDLDRQVQENKKIKFGYFSPNNIKE